MTIGRGERSSAAPLRRRKDLLLYMERELIGTSAAQRLLPGRARPPFSAGHITTEPCQETMDPDRTSAGLMFHEILRETSLIQRARSLL